MTEQYVLDSSVGGKINSCCAELIKNEKFKKLIDNANDPEKHLTTVKNMYLTYSQLTKRIGNLQNSLNQEKLKSLNRTRKLISLNKSLELHQRFMILIKENSIPKLHELVKVALRHKRGLSYII